MSEGQSLDFHQLSAEDLNKLVTAVSTLAAYNLERKEIGEAVKETLESLAADMKADKDAAKDIKRFVRKAATIYANNKTDDVRYENEIVELLLEKTNRSSIESE